MAEEVSYVIKKNAGSILNPWLMRVISNGQLAYGALHYLLHHSASLETFLSAESARRFITEHPNICDERNLVFRMVIASDNHSITFEPLEESVATPPPKASTAHVTGPVWDEDDNIPF